MSSETRNRLNRLAVERRSTVEAAMLYLLDEDWKRRCIEEADRFREEDPEGWREEQEELKRWDVTLADGLEDEPPFESDDSEWIARGGAPLTKQGGVA